MKQLVVYCMLMLATGFSLRSQEDLVGYWSFDDAGNEKFFDNSGNENHGTLFGAEVVQGIKGKALSFNGESDFAEITGNGNLPPAKLAQLGQGSISLWFRVNHIPTDYGIAPILYYGMEGKCDFFDAANQGLIIELGHSPIFPGSESLFFTIWKNGCTLPSFCYDSGNRISTDTWHHYVAVVGPDYNTGYLNGQEMVNRDYNFGDASYSQFFADALAHENLWLGKGHWDRTTQYYKGAIDELRIYSKPLSREEVNELYQLKTTGTEDAAVKNPADEVKLFPNPAKGVLNYDVSALDEPIQSVRIIDNAGKVRLQAPLTATSGKLDISQLDKSMYYIELYGEEVSFRKKIIIE